MNEHPNDPSAWTFRPLTTDDFEMVGGWLAAPAVARWWAQDPTPAGVEAHFGPAVRGEKPTEVRIAQLDGADVGLIQRYWWHAYPDYRAEVAPTHPIPDGAFSVDYFIGAPDLLARGHGPAMIDAFVSETFAAWPDATTVIVPVHADNRPSWRALEKAGFTIVGPVDLEPDNPIDSRDHVLARRDRAAPHRSAT